MTDADTKTSPSHLNAPTPVPRIKVTTGLHSSTPACVRHCLCLNSPQRTCYGNLCLSLSAVKCSVVVYAWHSRVKLA